MAIPVRPLTESPRGAWLAPHVNDPLATVPAIVLLVDPDTRVIIDASAAAAVFCGVDRPQLRRLSIDDLTTTPLRLPDAADGVPAEQAAPTVIERTTRMGLAGRSGPQRVVDLASSPVTWNDRRVIRIVANDVTEHVRVAEERDRMTMAVESAAEAILIADADAKIVYVNPAFERITGYAPAAVIGRNPKVMSSGRQPPAFYASMWATLLAGRPWTGELTNRRADGSLFSWETSITPICDTAGVPVSYVAVSRDVTTQRDVQASGPAGTAAAASVAAMLANFVPGPTPETAATAICERVLDLPGVAFAAIARFVPGERAEPLAALGRDNVPIPTIWPDFNWTSANRRRIRQVKELVSRGSIIEHAIPGPGMRMHDPLARLGVTALAAVPIGPDGHATGFLQVGATGAGAPRLLEELLPSIEAFAVVASVLLAKVLDERALLDQQRAVVERIMLRTAFRSVFQPIVDLESGEIVGHEALTRFTDGQPPDLVFAAAQGCGLGPDLEAATLRSALAAAPLVPNLGWLSLNVTPGFLLDGARLGEIVRAVPDLDLVMEVTEHDQIEDYAVMRDAIAALGRPVRIAVDDAGAGFASLRHILELRPQLIKLDRSLVAGLDTDLVRQAVVAGMRRFAESAGALLVAEGIETMDEVETLLSLDVRLGQGFLLGVPAPPPIRAI